MGRNYMQLDGPRYAGAPASAPAPRPVDALRVVSFNVQFALRVDSAIRVLATDPALRGADVVLLQEMDAPGTERIAEALGMWYAYYPATLHSKTGRDFGNAILSRWPIVSDGKIILPHLGQFNRTARGATAATIDVAGERVRVYSLHLATMVEIGPGRRRDQLAAVLSDARQFERVVIGGDLNSHGVGRVAREAGYDWPTEHGPRTARSGRIDHIFVRGLEIDAAATGTVTATHAASDHRPIWITARLPVTATR
jgi:endonuclease/exonuclease/phosphatase family metal-dependent hydrolase